MRALNPRLLALVLFGLSADPVLAAGQEATDMKLEDAGFVARLADTPDKIARLRKLPPRKFMRRTSAGKTYYIYADPDTCKCAFVGDEDAMKTFRDMAAARRRAFRLQFPDATSMPGGISPEAEMVEDMNDDVHGPVPEGSLLDYRF